MTRRTTTTANPVRIEVPSISTVTIPCDQYEALVKALTEIRIVRQYFAETNSTFANIDDIRLILGIPKEE